MFTPAGMVVRLAGICRTPRVGLFPVRRSGNRKFRPKRERKHHEHLQSFLNAEFAEGAEERREKSFWGFNS
jgi:hypothetical protein